MFKVSTTTSNHISLSLVLTLVIIYDYLVNITSIIYDSYWIYTEIHVQAWKPRTIGTVACRKKLREHRQLTVRYKRRYTYRFENTRSNVHSITPVLFKERHSLKRIKSTSGARRCRLWSWRNRMRVKYLWIGRTASRVAPGKIAERRRRKIMSVQEMGEIVTVGMNLARWYSEDTEKLNCDDHRTEKTLVHWERLASAAEFVHGSFVMRWEHIKEGHARMSGTSSKSGCTNNGALG